MKNQISSIFIVILIFSSLTSAYGQVLLNVTNASGCDTLNGIAYLSPVNSYDTITSISWIINNQTLSPDSDSLEFSLSDRGIYRLRVIVNEIYEIGNSVMLYVYSSPDARFLWTDSSGNNQFNYLFKGLPQDPDTLSYTYEWKISTEILGNLSQLSHSFSETGAYPVSLEVSSNAGCSAIHLETVVVKENLKCPNVFTPNMDTYNDVFTVKTDGLTTYSFSVFSKTGIKVYFSESPTISWDGRSLSGIEMQSGIYYYTIEEMSGDNAEKISGFVHLIR